MSGESLEDEGEKIAEMLVNAGREGREAEEMGILGVLMVRNASTDMICTRKTLSYIIIRILVHAASDLIHNLIEAFNFRRLLAFHMPCSGERCSLSG
ncbi:MAG: hypothetical protein CL912_06900 [Deltaproteobacteria bacterium]|nr:hypothetical protein [Deltaproteobacteria bacterium]|tara:strand:+ start:453 stop:743 length:291 start_codon:yes stop_codon:yes gene_type:complete